MTKSTQIAQTNLAGTKKGSTPKKINKRYRQYRYTINNYDKHVIKNILEWFNSRKNIVYCFQEEILENKNIPCLQGCLKSKDAINIDTIKKIMPTANIENCRNFDAEFKRSSNADTRIGKLYTNKNEQISNVNYLKQNKFITNINMQLMLKYIIKKFQKARYMCTTFDEIMNMNNYKSSSIVSNTYTYFLEQKKKDTVKEISDELPLSDLECLYFSYNSFNMCLLLDTDNYHIITNRRQRFNDYNKYHIDAINRVDMLSNKMQQWLIKLYKIFITNDVEVCDNNSIVIIDILLKFAQIYYVWLDDHRTSLFSDLISIKLDHPGNYQYTLQKKLESMNLDDLKAMWHKTNIYYDSNQINVRDKIINMLANHSNIEMLASKLNMPNDSVNIMIVDCIHKCM